LKRLKRIPDWLKDGFVDAQDFLADLTNSDDDSHLTGIVQIRPEATIVRPKRDIALVPSHEEPLSPGLALHLNRYKILRKLGSGGMGEVYLAEDISLLRKVALKVIYAHIGASAEFHQRFLREGQLVARLQHPNIVQVYDMQQLPTGQTVLVTEYVEGQSLDQLINKQIHLSLREALRIGIAIAKALEAAHTKSVIHRDIKPSNILITDNGDVKLLDFGIAKLAEDTSIDAITQTGAMIGTPAYMSPEQIQGLKIDVSTDLYSLGAVMYQMLTGKRYLDSNSMHNLMLKVMTENPPPPSVLNSSIPPELDEIILKSLEKDPKNRFSNATELTSELEVILNSLEKDSTQ
jgi:serine/threonine-protein kinase